VQNLMLTQLQHSRLGYSAVNILANFANRATIAGAFNIFLLDGS
jgi:hypothetical protein